MASQKKFVIKSFKNQLMLDATAAGETLSILDNAIDEIYNKNASKLSYEVMYRSCYNLVISKHGDLLYRGVAETIKKHLLETAAVVVTQPDDRLLTAVDESWVNHKMSVNMIKDILLYMDRTYVAQHKKASVFNLAAVLYREIILYNPGVRDRLRAIILHSIELERNGYLIDRELVKNILTMMTELGVDGVNVYEDEFETPFLTNTRAFYREESQAFLSQNSCPDFLVKAENRIEEESERARNYLAPSTEPKLKNLMDQEYIVAHAVAVVSMEETGGIGLMRDDKIDDLKRMYSLFSRNTSCLDNLRGCLSVYVKRCGEGIVSDQEKVKDSMGFVQKILDLKMKFDTIVKESFREDKRAQKCLKDAFEQFINKDARCAGHLATYVDELLRTGLKGAPEADVEQKLESVVLIFRFISDKDVFENLYRNRLSKRLLNGKSISEELERLMVSKLKHECGQQFTSKLEGMLLDLHLSKEIMEGYRNTAEFSSSAIEMEVQTLTTAHWGSLGTTLSCVLPRPVKDSCCNPFADYYLEKYKGGRRLTWVTQYGTADIKANFPLGRHELNVTTYQMCILMLFNESATLSLTQIRDACGATIPEFELRRHLLSMCTPKLRILKKSTKSKGIQDDEVLSFNDEFSSKFRRIKVPLIASSDTSAIGAASLNSSGVSGSSGASGSLEDESVPVAVGEDRRHLIEASLVRIMKTRRRLSHNELVAEVSRQLSTRFSPTLQLIKNRVESLIEREYLQRDADDRRTYVYLA